MDERKDGRVNKEVDEQADGWMEDQMNGRRDSQLVSEGLRLWKHTNLPLYTVEPRSEASAYKAMSA